MDKFETSARKIDDQMRDDSGSQAAAGSSKCSLKSVIDNDFW